MQFPKVLKHVLDRQLKSGMHRLWLHASTSTMAQLTGLFTHLICNKVTGLPSFGRYHTLQYTCNFPVRMFASEDLVETRQRERRTVLFQILAVESSVLENFYDIQGYSGTNPTR